MSSTPETPLARLVTVAFAATAAGPLAADSRYVARAGRDREADFVIVAEHPGLADAIAAAGTDPALLAVDYRYGVDHDTRDAVYVAEVGEPLSASDRAELAAEGLLVAELQIVSSAADLPAALRSARRAVLPGLRRL